MASVTSKAPLTLSQVNRMAEVFAETLSIRGTARVLGHDIHTVDKYVNHGDPSRGIESIKAQLAKSGVKLPAAVSPNKYLEKTIEDATKGSKAILRAVKELYGLKLTHMLRSFDEAYASGDPKKVESVHEKYHNDLRFKDLPKILEVEQALWGNGGTSGLPPVRGTNREEKIAAIKALLKDQSILLNRESPQDTPETVTQQVCNECGNILESGTCATCRDDDSEESAE